jgi:probable rRNA maturation factor
MGDIIIAPNQALGDAREEGVTPQEKFRELILHSILHLMGYDHETPADSKKLEKKRAFLLNAINIRKATGTSREK